MSLAQSSQQMFFGASAKEVVEDEFDPIGFGVKKEKIKFKVTSVDTFVLKCKKLSFITQMLSEPKHDFGFK